MARGSLTPLEALERIKNAPTIYVGCGSDVYTRYSFECEKIENALKILEYLKEICLEGKDKYGKNTWGWVEFDLDKHPKLKEWLKDEH